MYANVPKGRFALANDLDSVKEAFLFLERNGLINYGILKQLNPTPPQFDQNTIVIVIGAGTAGISAARELFNIFNNAPGKLIPRIVLFEGRQRIGGNTFSFPLHSRWTDKDQHPCVDLGGPLLSILIC